MKSIEHRLTTLEDGLRTAPATKIVFHLTVGSECRGRLIGARWNCDSKIVKRLAAESEADFMSRVKREDRWPLGETMRILHQVRDDELENNKK
jgi:hypothetical protein